MSRAHVLAGELEAAIEELLRAARDLIVAERRKVNCENEVARLLDRVERESAAPTPEKP